MNKYEFILKEFIQEWEKQPEFPVGYCNPCTRALQKILTAQGIETEQMFSYKKKGEGHTFLITTDGYIIDPTYGQYNKCYLRGFIGKTFPNKLLQKNITGGLKFMELQQKWLKEGVYKFE